MSNQLNYYTKNKKKYPRVTSIIGVIIDPGLDAFKKNTSDKQFNETMETARERGTNFDKLTQLYFKGGNMEALSKGLKFGQPDLYEPFKTFLSWADVKIDKVISYQETVFNDVHGYAGTPDFVARIKGRKLLTLFDIKFKAKLNYKENLQTAAYVPAAEKLLGEKIGDRMILQFNKSGKMNIERYTDQATDFGHFLYCLQLYKKFN